MSCGEMAQAISINYGGHLTVAEIEEKGIAWGDNGCVVFLDPTVKDFALRFRRAGHAPVVRDHPGLYLWIHDAIHGWLGRGPDFEGELCVQQVQHAVGGVRTCEDFLTLMSLCTPFDFTKHEQGVMTTKDEIRDLLERAKKSNQGHVIIVCDTFSHDAEIEIITQDEIDVAIRLPITAYACRNVWSCRSTDGLPGPGLLCRSCTRKEARTQKRKTR